MTEPTDLTLACHDLDRSVKAHAAHLGQLEAFLAEAMERVAELEQQIALKRQLMDELSAVVSLARAASRPE